MTALRSVIDPADLRWIWLTHTDFDHIGALPQLLAENPQLRVATTFLSVGIMSLSAPLPLDRITSSTQGRSSPWATAPRPRLGHRCSTTRPPRAFMTTSRGRWSAPTASGPSCKQRPRTGRPLRPGAAGGQVFWATLDSPWLHKVDEAAFAKELNSIRDMDPPGPEQPSAGRPRQHDATAAGLPGGRPDCSALRRTRSGGAGGDVGPDDRAAVAPAARVPR